MTIRLIQRSALLFFLLPALVFFIALAMGLGQAGGWSALLDAIPSASEFTKEYLANLAHGDMGSIAPSYGSAPAVPVTAELARALPRSLGLLAVSLALTVLIGLPLGIVAGLRRKTSFSGLLVFLSLCPGHLHPQLFCRNALDLVHRLAVSHHRRRLCPHPRLWVGRASDPAGAGAGGPPRR